MEKAPSESSLLAVSTAHLHYFHRHWADAGLNVSPRLVTISNHRSTAYHVLTPGQHREKIDGELAELIRDGPCS